MKHLIAILVIASQILTASAAEPIDYFGAAKPETTPKRFPFDEIVPDPFQVGNPVFSKDGCEFYFTDNKSINIFVMRKDEESWGNPVQTPFSYEGRNYEPFLTADGDTIYFVPRAHPVLILATGGFGDQNAPMAIGACPNLS